MPEPREYGCGAEVEVWPKTRLKRLLYGEVRAGQIVAQHVIRFDEAAQRWIVRHKVKFQWRGIMGSGWFNTDELIPYCISERDDA